MKSACATASRMGPLQRSERRWAVILLAPYVLGLLGFQAGPILATWLISLCQWDIVTPPRWIGGANFTRLAADPLFWKALGNTLYYTAVSVPLGVLLSLALALAANRALRGISFYRTAFFLPVVTSTVAVSLVWAWFYDTNFGVLNFLIDKTLGLAGLHGFKPIPWLASPRWAMFSIILMSVWKGLGYNMVIFLAALQDIPTQLYEAAEVDGAGRWARLRHIMFPMLSPVLFFVVIIGLIGAFQVFDQVYIMAHDGRPAGSTLTLVYYLYNNAFTYMEMGYACAIGSALFLIILLVTLVQLWGQRYWVHYR